MDDDERKRREQQKLEKEQVGWIDSALFIGGNDSFDELGWVTDY